MKRKIDNSNRKIVRNDNQNYVDNNNNNDN